MNSGRARCAGCGRPISIPPPAQLMAAYDASVSTSTASASSSDMSQQAAVPIWGLPSSCGVVGGKPPDSMTRSTLVVFLPNKVTYHRICYDLKSNDDKASSTSTMKLSSKDNTK